MKRGSVLVPIFWLVFFGIIAFVANFVWTNYSKLPNDNTKKTANSLIRYPTATSWEIEESKNLCLKPEGCSQPIKIFFETPNGWGQIYEYYVTYLKNQGWTTNTNVITSVPTSVVFEKNKCTIAMNNHGDIKYSITVVCLK